jgi:hypothetical protein
MFESAFPIVIFSQGSSGSKTSAYLLCCSRELEVQQGWIGRVRDSGTL